MCFNQRLWVQYIKRIIILFTDEVLRDADQIWLQEDMTITSKLTTNSLIFPYGELIFSLFQSRFSDQNNVSIQLFYLHPAKMQIMSVDSLIKISEKVSIQPVINNK